MAIDSTIDGTTSVRPGLSRVIIAATIGNVLEGFDFIVYGFFAVIIAEVFFPASNPTVSLLVTTFRWFDEYQGAKDGHTR